VWASSLGGLGAALRTCYEMLHGVSELKKKRPLGRPRRRWEDNIIKDLREIGWEGLEWIHLAQDKDR